MQVEQTEEMVALRSHRLSTLCQDKLRHGRPSMASEYRSIVALVQPESKVVLRLIFELIKNLGRGEFEHEMEETGFKTWSSK